MDTQNYNTVADDAQGEITEKKSRFICNLYHIEREEEIAVYVEALRKKHYQARHVCFAAILSDKGDVLKYSDDGEPSGTAGKPMLEILKGRQLTYTLACVTRYFGGVLLGTGGLVRAYSDALNAALESATIVTRRLCRSISCVVDYQTIGKIKYSLDNYEAVVTAEEYSDRVKMTVSMPEANTDRFLAFVTDISAGKAETEKLGIDYV